MERQSWIGVGRMRSRSVRFWLRLLAAIVLGQVAAAFGLACTSISVALFGAGIEQPGRWGAVLTQEWWRWLLIPIPYIATISLAFQAFILLLIPATVSSLPFTMLAALCFRTTRLQTMLYGAAIGLFFAVPVAWRFYGGVDGLIVACSPVSGALFMWPIWHLCIAPWCAHR